jgi:AcrR family transcriptional regulator
MIPAPTTRDRLLAAAVERFAEAGFHRTSVRDICDRARANPGAVSYHFKGKAQLRRAAVRHAVDTITSALDDDTNHDQRLASRMLLDAVSRHPREVRLLLRELADGGQLLAEAAPPLLRDHLSPGRDAVDPDAAEEHRARRVATLQTLAAGLLAAAWPFLERHFRLDDEDRTAACEAIRSAVVR